MAIRLIVQGPSAESLGRAYSLLFDQPRIHLGRSASADLCLPHASVSALHASIRLEGSSYVVVDEGSTNGTRVDTQLLPPKRKKKLVDGALIHIGAFAVRIELLNALPEPADPRRCAQIARALLVDLLEADGKTLPPPSLYLEARDEIVRLIDFPLPLTIGQNAAGELSTDSEAGAINEPLGRVHEDGASYSLEALSEELMIDDQPFRRRKLRSGATITHLGARILFRDPIEEELEARYLLDDEEGDFELPASDGVEADAGGAAAMKRAPDGASAKYDATPPGLLAAGDELAPRDMDGSSGHRSAGGDPLESGSPMDLAATNAAAATSGASSSARWSPRSRNAPLIRRGAEGPDALVYMLAGAMIALSALGLYLLLGRL